MLGSVIITARPGFRAGYFDALFKAKRERGPAITPSQNLFEVVAMRAGSRAATPRHAARRQGTMPQQAPGWCPHLTETLALFKKSNKRKIIAQRRLSLAAVRIPARCDSWIVLTKQSPIACMK